MFPRVALLLLSILVIVIVCIGAWLYAGGPVKLWRDQMAAGAEYMKSLDESDVPQWIERTERFLAERDPSVHPIGVYGGVRGKTIPFNLLRLRIIRIDIFEDNVRYVWMGGMDHTNLEVRRLADGRFTLIAHYNDYKSEVIWPKRPNGATQLTASKSATYAWSVCRRNRMLRRMDRGLAAAVDALAAAHSHFVLGSMSLRPAGLMLVPASNARRRLEA